MRSYQNFIGGEWVPARSGATMQTRNPADAREVVAEYPASGVEDALAAVAAAEKAAPGWADATAVARGRVLSKASQLLEARKAELAELLTREEGKTLAESTGEVQRAVDIFRFYGGLSYTIGGRTIPHDMPGNLLYTTRRPVGIVALITPWNFPVAIPAWKLAPALVTGNAVILKPAGVAPALSLELAPRMARAQMEMGGKNPTIVLADADLDLAANLVARSGLGLTGQACTATSRVIVDKSVLATFTEKLVAKAKAWKVGNGLTAGIDMGPAVTETQLKGNLEWVKTAVAGGAQVLTGGNRITTGDFAHGWFMEPTIIGGVTPAMRIACEEVFGPVIAVIPAENFDDALKIANGVDVGLSASLVTRDFKNALRYAEKIEAGVVKVNQISTGLALQAPFGGVKQSSTDSFKEQGVEALDFYTRTKTVYLDYSV